MKAALEAVLRDETLTPLFQPIVDIRSQKVLGYEALIRGPVNTHLHMPIVLFSVAKKYGKTQELEQLCCRLQMAKFIELGLQGLLFLNLSPELFIDLSRAFSGQIPPWLDKSTDHNRLKIVVELSESELTRDYDQLRIAAERCRRQGIQFAIDDLGEGYASLRLWSELQPEFVKLDRYFAHHIHRHPFKQQLLKAISEVALQNKTFVIAEGIEQECELDVLQIIGVSHGQGFYLGHPVENPLLKTKQ